MRFFSSIFRFVVIAAALCATLMCGVACFLGDMHAWLADPMSRAAARSEFLLEPLWYRACIAGLGCMAGMLASGLVLGPVALLYEIRDSMADLRDRLAATPRPDHSS